MQEGLTIAKNSTRAVRLAFALVHHSSITSSLALSSVSSRCRAKMSTGNPRSALTTARSSCRFNSVYLRRIIMSLSFPRYNRRTYTTSASVQRASAIPMRVKARVMNNVGTKMNAELTRIGCRARSYRLAVGGRLSTGANVVAHSSIIPPSQTAFRVEISELILRDTRAE